MNLDTSLLSDVDDAATKQEKSRSRFIADVLRTYFSPKEPSSNEVALLNKQIEHLNEIITIRENEITELREREGFLRMEYSKCNDRLNRYLLPEVAPPRRSFWDRFRRKKE